MSMEAAGLDSGSRPFGPRMLRWIYFEMPRLDMAVSALNDLARFLEQLAGMGNRLRGAPLDLLGSPSAVVQILLKVMRRQKRLVLLHPIRHFRGSLRPSVLTG